MLERRIEKIDRRTYGKKIALLFFILLAPSWVFAKTVNRDGFLVVRVNKNDVYKYYSEDKEHI